MSAARAIQAAVYGRLTGDLALMAKITGVYDDVPQDIVFPYVTIGDATALPWRTQSRYGEESTITLHIWSRYEGYKEALEIMEDLNRLLADQSFSVTGWDVCSTYFDFYETLRDPDGQTRHVVARYRIQLQDA